MIKKLLAREIAEIQFNIWKFHDQKNYEGVKKSAESLLIKFGIPEVLIPKISEEIKKAFVEYDLVDEKAKNSDLTQSELLQALTNVYKAQKSTLELLGEKKAKELAWYHTLLWREYINKSKTESLFSYIRIMVYLFLLEYKRGGLIDAFKKCPYLLLGGYRGHYGRDKNSAIKYLTPYFEKTLENNSTNYPDIFH